MLQVNEIQTGSRVSRVTDQDFARASFGCEPRGNIDIITQRGEISWTILTSYYADKGWAGMDANSHWKPGSLGIAVTCTIKQILSRLDCPARVLRSGKAWNV